jgi:hypothetical protein
MPSLLLNLILIPALLLLLLLLWPVSCIVPRFIQADLRLLLATHCCCHTLLLPHTAAATQLLLPHTAAATHCCCHTLLLLLPFPVPNHYQSPMSSTAAACTNPSHCDPLCDNIITT